MILRILGIPINLVSYDSVIQQVLMWARETGSRMVFAANVHMLMEAYDSQSYNQIVSSADLVVPDGMPLVWMLRLKGQREQTRVYGPTLMLRLLESAAHERIPVGFYGSSPQVLALLIERMKASFVGLKVAFQYSPPYRDLTPNEDAEIISDIRGAGAKIVFVGLGCPRQERWMVTHREHLDCIMVGVGAAFDFHSGMKPQAPLWIQRIGMEWFYRLLSEPRRLWRRYFFHNPRFILLAIFDLLGLIH